MKNFNVIDVDNIGRASVSNFEAVLPKKGAVAKSVLHFWSPRDVVYYCSDWISCFGANGTPPIRCRHLAF